MTTLSTELNPVLSLQRAARTRTVIAVLEVSFGYHNDELAMEMESPGDIVLSANVFDDRRTLRIPVQRDRRGSSTMTRRVPVMHDPRAF